MTKEELLRLTRGIALATVTPLKKDGGVDDKAIYQLVHFLLEGGLSRENGFLIPLSTTGNFLSLTLEERKEVARSFLKAASGHIPIVVGCNHIRLSEIIELAKFSQDEGAIAIMVGPPFYWKPTDAQIITYYNQICRSIKIGVIIYNNHWASQVDISEDTIERIAENPNIIGLKESTYSIEKLIQITRRFSARINILNGPGEAYEPLYTQLGCVGFTSTLGNIVPELSVRLYSYLVNNSFQEARQLAIRMAPLTHLMDSLTGGQYIVALMQILNRFGVCENIVRPPLIALTDQEINKLEQLVSALKLKS